jgi:hypothetical protein
VSTVRRTQTAVVTAIAACQQWPLQHRRRSAAQHQKPEDQKSCVARLAPAFDIMFFRRTSF